MSNAVACLAAASLGKRQRVLTPDGQPVARGYDLVASGRLTPVPDGKVIACRLNALDSPPDCVISVDIDRVRFEDPRSKTVLAEWRN